MSPEEQIDQICDKFEQAWNDGEMPTIQRYLDQIPLKHHAAVLENLVPVDVECRTTAGQLPAPADYAQFGPSAVQAAAKAIEMLAASTNSFSPGDAVHEKTFIGEASDNADDDRLTQSQMLDSFHKVTRPEETSPVIGPYKILQKIGEGGMGNVFMAEQTHPVRRRVALKLIKAGMDSKDVITRFEAERQALALMDHPHIAKVLDAGTTKDGRPYFVMELVQGIPITEYCDKNKLSIEDRLELFTQTCRAIQHAHQKGIIHRDIKPSNVLVTQHDGVPSVEVIDFGLAKALQSATRLTDKTMFTEFGQVLGTFQYMSPEQAEMNALDVDTRSDVYSLGVLLYELLTGSTPIEKQRLKEMALDRILIAIREQEAQRPSTRLSSLGEQATAVSEQRKTDVRRLGVILKGDLDWIAMKALEKDRTRRYDSPTQMSEDVNRYLKGEAIVARPPSLSYRISKTIRKNKVATVVIAGALLLTTIAAGATTKLWLNTREQQIADAKRAAADLERIKKEADEAKLQEKKTQELLDFANKQKKIADEKTAEAKHAETIAKNEARKAKTSEEVAKAEATRATKAEDKAKLAAVAEKKAADLAEQRRKEAEEAAAVAKAAEGKATEEAKKAINAEKLARQKADEAMEANARTLSEKQKSDVIRSRSQYLLAEERLRQLRFDEAWDLLQQIPLEHRGFEWNLTNNELSPPTGSQTLVWNDRDVCDFHPTRNVCLTVDSAGTLHRQSIDENSSDTILVPVLGPIRNACWVTATEISILTKDDVFWTYDEESAAIGGRRDLREARARTPMILLDGGGVVAGRELFVKDRQEAIAIDIDGHIRSAAGGSSIVVADGRKWHFISPENGKVLRQGSLATDLDRIHAWTRSGKQVVTRSSEEWTCKLRVIDLSSGKIERVLQGIGTDFLNIAISSDDQFVAAMSMEGVLQIWSLADGTLKNTVRLNKSQGVGGYSSRSLSWHSSDRAIAVWGEHGLVSFPWEKPQGVERLAEIANECTSVCYAPAGDYLIVGDSTGRLHFWSCKGKKQIREFCLGNDDQEVSSIAAIPYGDTWQAIASLSDGSVFTCAPDTAEVQEIASAEPMIGCELRADLTGRLVYKIGYQKDTNRKIVEVLRIDGTRAPMTIPYRDGMADIASRHDGHSALLAVNGRLEVFNVDSGETRLIDGVRFEDEIVSGSLCCSEQGLKTLAVTSSQKISVLNGPSMGVSAVFRGHIQLCATAMQLSPDGSRAITGGGGACAIIMPPDFSLRIWDSATGEELWMRTHNTYPRSIALEPGLREFAVLWGDGSLVRYSASPADTVD